MYVEFDFKYKSTLPLPRAETIGLTIHTHNISRYTHTYCVHISLFVLGLFDNLSDRSATSMKTKKRRTQKEQTIKTHKKHQ